MKKYLLLLTALFVVVALNFAYSSNETTNNENAATEVASMSYNYIYYHVGDIYPDTYYNQIVIITVNYRGEYLGTSPTLSREGEYKFRWNEPWLRGEDLCIGEVATVQDRQTVVYRIHANVR